MTEYEHFNKLTPAEAERLAMLAEEAAEIIAVIGKILRHGYESYNPTIPVKGTPVTNRMDLERELGDLAGVAKHMATRGDIDAHNVTMASEVKMPKAQRWMHHYEPLR